MSFQDLIKEGFEVENGKVYDRYHSYTGFEVCKFGWGAPEYQIKGNGEYGEYNICQDAYKDWILRKGYSEVMKLNYYGCEHWKSF